MFKVAEISKQEADNFWNQKIVESEDKDSESAEEE
jgi:hypothetical protein